MAHTHILTCRPQLNYSHSVHCEHLHSDRNAQKKHINIRVRGMRKSQHNTTQNTQSNIHSNISCVIFYVLTFYPHKLNSHSIRLNDPSSAHTKFSTINQNEVLLLLLLLGGGHRYNLYVRAATDNPKTASHKHVHLVWWAFKLHYHMINECERFGILECIYNLVSVQCYAELCTSSRIALQEHSRVVFRLVCFLVCWPGVIIRNYIANLFHECDDEESCTQNWQKSMRTKLMFREQTLQPFILFFSFSSSFIRLWRADRMRQRARQTTEREWNVWELLVVNETFLGGLQQASGDFR